MEPIGELGGVSARPREVSPSVQEPAPVSGGKKTWMFSLIGIVVVVLIVAAFFIFRGDTGEGQSQIGEPGQELTAQQLKTGVLGEASKINSYHVSFSVDMEMRTSSPDLGDFLMTSVMVYEGDVDTLAQELALVGSMTSEAPGFDMDVELESYIVDGYYYSHVFGSWVKQEVDEAIWNEKAQANQITELIESGELEITGEDSFGGSEYYIAELNPNLGDLVANSLGTQEQSDLYDDAMNFDDIIREYSGVLWINKDTLFVEKSITTLKMVLNSENMGDTFGSGGVGEIQMDSVTEFTISNINEDVEIVLPDGALDAQEMSVFQSESGSDVLLSPVGKEMEKFFG